MNTLCIIPAKGNSKRLKNKNLRELNGKPLVGLAIEKALQSGVFDEIVLSTEDAEISKVGRAFGAEVPFLRPQMLASDPATITDVILHCIEKLMDLGRSYDTLVVVLPTSPLLETNDISAAMKLYLELSPCSVLSVCLTEFPPYNTWIKAENGNIMPAFPDSEFVFTKSTECPVTYRSNGAIMICDVKNLLRERTYRNLPIAPYVMPQMRSIDVDTYLDFKFAEFLFKRYTGDSQI